MLGDAAGRVCDWLYMGGGAAMIAVNLFERIRRMARSGLGYDDIAVTLKLLPRQVRPFVIGNRHDDVSKVQSDMGQIGRGTQHPVRSDRDGV